MALPCICCEMENSSYRVRGYGHGHLADRCDDGPGLARKQLQLMITIPFTRLSRVCINYWCWNQAPNYYCIE